jgi:hypothetical protein
MIIEKLEADDRINEEDLRFLRRSGLLPLLLLLRVVTDDSNENEL